MQFVQYKVLVAGPMLWFDSLHTINDGLSNKIYSEWQCLNKMPGISWGVYIVYTCVYIR